MKSLASRGLAALMYFFISMYSTDCAAQDSITSISIHPGAVIIQHPVNAKPEPWAFLKYQPSDLGNQVRAPFKKKNLVWTGVVIGSTAILIHFDQDITNDVHRIANGIHLHRETNYNNLIKFGTTKILKLPNNLNTAAYEMGEGWVGMAVAGGLYIHGKLAGNYRSAQAASDLTEGFIATAISTQIIKRFTGRQSPFEATVPGGAWRPFPSFSNFQKHTSAYDAFPSGHLATMMTYVTILTEDYPEKKWLKPLGYSLMAASSFAMLNTDVHWAGDYPLALAIGYINGRYITGRHKKPRPPKYLP